MRLIGKVSRYERYLRLGKRQQFQNSVLDRYKLYLRKKQLYSNHELQVYKFRPLNPQRLRSTNTYIISYILVISLVFLWNFVSWQLYNIDKFIRNSQSDKQTQLNEIIIWKNTNFTKLNLFMIKLFLFFSFFGMSLSEFTQAIQIYIKKQQYSNYIRKRNPKMDFLNIGVLQTYPLT